MDGSGTGVHAPDGTGQAGYSLIELLTVCILIGILAAIAVPAFVVHRDSATEAAVEATLRNASLYQAMLQQEGDPAGSIDDLEGAGFRYSADIIELSDGDLFDEEPEPCIQGRAAGRPDHVYSLRPSDRGRPRTGPCQ